MVLVVAALVAGVVVTAPAAAKSDRSTAARVPAGRPHQHVTFHLVKTHVMVGESTHAYGKVTPPGRQPVALEASRHHRWRPIRWKHTNSAGKFHFKVRRDKKGIFDFRAFVRARPGYRWGASMFRELFVGQ
jgi:hypothetical protein